MAGTAVMVFDKDDPKRGELTMLAGSQDAARLAEQLLEAGIELERIHIFEATELSMRVAHKPVVMLNGG